MRAAESGVGHRLGRVMASASTVVGIAALLGMGPLACAGKHHINEAPPHPIAVEINNNLTVPTELTVYVVQDQGGPRQMLGTVPGAQTKTFTFTPLAWSQTYRLLGERQLSGPVRSPSFTISDPETGTVSWAVIPNQVQFYELADTTQKK
jgi:hypothetical protein